MPNHRYWLKGFRVLVLDESVEMTSLLTDVFAGRGACVTAANGALEAMRLLLFGRFDLVTVEVMGEQHDRMRVLEFIRHCRRDLLPRTLVITALRYDRQLHAILNGMDIPYLFKPFNIEDIYGFARQRLMAAGPTAVA